MSKNSKISPRSPEGPRVGIQSPVGRSSAVAINSKKKKRTPLEASSGIKLGPPETNSTDFIFYQNPTLTLVCVPRGTQAIFSLDAAAHLTGTHPNLLRYYWRSGLIEIHERTAEGIFFDETALHEIRRIEHYRKHLGVGRRALPLICRLQRESADQQIELHFLRYPRASSSSGSR